MLARAEALTEGRALRRVDRGVREPPDRAARYRRGRPRGSRARGRGVGARRAWRRPRGARSCSSRRAELAERPELLGRRPRRPAVPAGRLPLQAFEHRDRGRALQRGARRSPRARACRATCFAPRSSTGARAAIAGSATSRPRARTSSARSSSPRRSTTGARWRTSSSRPRSSPSAMGHWVLARSYAERARGYYQELNDERNVGRPAEQPRRPEPPARQARAGDRAPEGVVQRRCSRWTATRGGAGRRLARHGAPRPRRAGSRPSSRRVTRWRCSSGREDYLHEIAPTQLVLGRALMEQGRLEEAEQWLRTCRLECRADWSRSSHRAAAWIALGDLAARAGTTTGGRRGCTGTPPRLYRMSGSKEEGGEYEQGAHDLVRGLAVRADGIVLGLRTWAAPLPWKGQQLVRALDHPGAFGAGSAMAPNAAGPCRAALLLSGSRECAGGSGGTTRLDSARGPRRRRPPCGSGSQRRLRRFSVTAHGRTLDAILAAAGPRHRRHRRCLGVRAGRGALPVPGDRERREAGRAPAATVWVATGRNEQAVRAVEREARADRRAGPLERRLRRRHAIYVAHLRVPRPGRYWLVAEPDGAKICRHSAASTCRRALTERRPSAPARRTRTRRRSRRAPAAQLTTRQPARPRRSALLGGGSRSPRTSRSSSRSRRRSSAPAAPAGRSSTSSRPRASSSRRARPVHPRRGLPAATTRRRATTAGCASGASRASRGCSSSGRDGRVKAKFEGSVSQAELRRRDPGAPALALSVPSRNRADRHEPGEGNDKLLLSPGDGGFGRRRL